jgi:hypothetical protein
MEPGRSSKNEHMQRFLTLSFFILLHISVQSQDSSKIFLTTSVGIINGLGNFSKIVRPSVAFNSGIEFKINRKWFMQGTIDFNSLKYNQQVLDNNSPYLFQSTSSSLLLIGVNAGYHIPLSSKIFISLYGGAGFLNITEPRIQFDNNTLIAKQKNISSQGFFGRAGTRLAYNTRSKLLQTIYLEGIYWGSPTKIQQTNITGYSMLIGTRFGL